eukprot:Platyproteum_vivax@DN3545_c0_g1_i1.p3
MYQVPCFHKSEYEKVQTLMTYSDLENLWHRCETRIFRAVVHLLSSGESDYLEKRNVVTVLDKLIQNFPTEAKIGNILHAQITKVESQCSAQGLLDVALRFKSYGVKLHKRKSLLIDNGKPAKKADKEEAAAKSAQKRDRSVDENSEAAKKRRDEDHHSNSRNRPPP